MSSIEYNKGQRVSFSYEAYCLRHKILTPKKQPRWCGGIWGTVARKLKNGKVEVQWDDGKTTLTTSDFLNSFKIRKKKERNS